MVDEVLPLSLCFVHKLVPDLEAAPVACACAAEWNAGGLCAR